MTPRSALKNAAILTAAIGAAAAVAIGPAVWISGSHGMWAVAAAAALCLAPGWLVFAFAGRYGTAAPLAGVLVGMVGRMAFVLAGVLVLKALRPEFGSLTFALWLGLFYLLSLAVETMLLLAPPSRGTASED